ncbi:MAG: TMEM175 family protein [Gammaproteobacteria bacterium]|nr:TMEM175 family protein [Gammaproteobacteria bacterium]
MTSTHLLKTSRLEGLTDGVFAIAMTILILDLRVPAQIGSTALLLYCRF